MSAAETTTSVPAWQHDIADQLAQIDVSATTTHLVVHVPEDGPATLLDLCESQNAGVISAEDHATKVDGGEVSVLPIDTIRQVQATQYEVDTDGNVVVDGESVPEEEEQPAPLEPDADKGKLFDMPRPAVIVDDADPNVLKISFSGGVEIQRGDKDWVDFYNALRAGKTGEIRVGVYTGGSTKTHRRDKSGNVDATVETKSITITDVYLDA
jgi:catechol 2,3-dioxygenase-like lactoylglutathione lyase family enzyme